MTPSDPVTPGAPRDAPVPELELLFRDGCHLCEDMRDTLADLLPPGSYTLRERDIDEDPVLLAEHHVRVPVLRLDGHELCHHFLDLDAVRAALAGYTRAMPAAR